VWENQAMSASKPKAKADTAATASAKRKLLGSGDARTLQEKQFSAVVEEIAKRFGVKVAAMPPPTKNPYAMTAEQAAKIARQAGIITRAGNLTHRFK
jgi:hypothetical protein